MAGRVACLRCGRMGAGGGDDAGPGEARARTHVAAEPVTVKQYEIWWADLPQPVGKRPVLLLSRDAAYAYLHRVLAVEVTTRARGIPQEVTLGKSEGMARPCVANLDNLRAIPKEALRERAGRLAGNRVQEIKRAMGHALGWIELA